MRNLHKEITDKILAQLRAGVAPWRKPWSEIGAGFGTRMPHNAVTGRPYSGVNILLLWGAADANAWGPRWLTFKQAKEAGGTVRKGEHGQTVIFVKRMLVKDKDDPTKTRPIGFLRSYTVFNVAQCDGLSDRVSGKVEAPAPIDRNARNAELDAFIQATGATINEGGSKAAYSPVIDSIMMPPLRMFKTSDHFYQTVFHELGHWTGHPTRLNRQLKNRFGDREYAAEELIAELTSAFVCGEFGIDMEEAPAAYLNHWASLLEEKETAIVTAAAAASRAVEWLRGAALAEEADADEEVLEAA